MAIKTKGGWTSCLDIPAPLRISINLGVYRGVPSRLVEGHEERMKAHEERVARFVAFHRGKRELKECKDGSRTVG